MSTSWFKSTYSGSEKTCVEVSRRSDAVLIRDSKYVGPEAEQPIITVPSAEWPVFLDLALSAVSGTVGARLSVAVHADRSAEVADGTSRLVYNADEWDAFAKGVADGQFTWY